MAYVDPLAGYYNLQGTNYGNTGPQAYDIYGQNAQRQKPQGPLSFQDAVLNGLATPNAPPGPSPAGVASRPNDFNLGGVSPAAGVSSTGPSFAQTNPVTPAAAPYTGPAPAVDTRQSRYGAGFSNNDPTTWNPPKQSKRLATPEELATLTPEQRKQYDIALNDPLATDPLKFAKTDLDALGRRDYQDKMQGGSVWETMLGPPPKGYVYNANGGLMKESGWDKFDDVMTATTIGGLTGGLSTGPLAAATIGGAVANAVTGENVPRDAMGNPFVDGRGAVTPGPTGGVPATNTAAATTTDAAATPAGGITLPADVDTNGYAKPGYAVAGSPQAPPGWDQAKWANTAHQSPKYAVGRIMSQYPQTTEGLKQAMPEIIKAYPGAVQTGEDTIKIPGVGEIDVVKAGGGFWWGPETDANGNPIAKSGGGDGGDSAANLAAGYNIGGDAADSSTISKLIAQLGKIGGVRGKGGVISARDAVLNNLRV
jgi:hypothetical protein